ncbi:MULTISPECIES: pyridoxamine 5'-phosphate oxidase family protein [Haloarcula]|uniref:pyridoxamine 5'-phosphate oxidase family protein n=1 Tax=Haloarcula TaxID=2237 RepID=UPI0023E8E39D|nr:pyridoxamine 5'-phosphate oxidase family protein [Halomicroarcula sp. SHR3]
MTVEDLDSFGMHRMDDDDIEGTLSSQSVGVLGVPTDGAPMLRPLSYWYDGDDALYFIYVLGSESEKATVTDQAGVAQFLVYSVETTFNWRSVLLTGTIEAVSEAEREALEERMDIAWRPDLFERAGEARRDAPRSEANRGVETTAIYRFDIHERAGIKQLELPPELREPDSSGRME